jgi:hypothetical protein
MAPSVLSPRSCDFVTERANTYTDQQTGGAVAALAAIATIVPAPVATFTAGGENGSLDS